MLLEIMLAIYGVLSLSAGIIAFMVASESRMVKFSVALFMAVVWPLVVIATAFTFLLEE